MTDSSSTAHTHDSDSPVRYPPGADGALSHGWMREGALRTLEAIERSFDFGPVRRMLDVGRGDATIACELVRRHPDLRSTVFAAPGAARLGLADIESRGLDARVSVVVGDLLTDPLPLGGFDLVMFSRVLADWSPEVCRMLLTRARDSLAPSGLLLIAEPLREQDPGPSLARERGHPHRTSAVYQALLHACGFAEVVSFPRSDASIHGVLTARRA
jgi:hypothetical protein